MPQGSEVTYPYGCLPFTATTCQFGACALLKNIKPNLRFCPFFLYFRI